MENFSMEGFNNFIVENKWALLMGFIAFLLIILGLVGIVGKILFFVLMIIVGVYIDRNEEKVREFFRKLMGKEN